MPLVRTNQLSGLSTLARLERARALRWGALDSAGRLSGAAAPSRPSRRRPVGGLDFGKVKLN
jgi:hypothetical protein